MGIKPRIALTTAVTIKDVMWWIELTPHHIVDASSKTHIELRGHLDKLRVPNALWAQCFIKRGHLLDTRAYRWDHAKHRQDILNRIKQPKTRDAFYSKTQHMIGCIFIQKQKDESGVASVSYEVRFKSKFSDTKVETYKRENLIWNPENAYWTTK